MKGSVRLSPPLSFEEDFEKSTSLEPIHFRSVRPSGGLSTKEARNIISKEVNKEVSFGQALT